MAKKFFKENFRYRFDNLMSRGTLSLIGFLAAIFIILIIIFTLIIWISNLIPGQGIIEIFWLNIFKTLNTGTLPGAKNNQANFFISFFIALASIFITSLLIGLLTAGIQQKIWSLRKGRSKIKESKHTIILGWSEIIFTVVSSLIEANKNNKKFKIAIMGDKDKVEMEDALREKIKRYRRIKIICRKGNPMKLGDLKIVNLAQSKSVIIVEGSDSKVLKTILAINNSKDVNSKTLFNITAVLKDGKNLNSARIAGAGRTEFIVNEGFISRLIAHTCYQPGLSLVYSDLLSFEGDEIYIAEPQKEIIGQTFKDAAFMFEDSILIGIKDLNKVKLNPPKGTIIDSSNKIIAISKASDTINIYRGEKEYEINFELIQNTRNFEVTPKKILILGWNDKSKSIIRELEKYISTDTEMTIVCEKDSLEDFERQKEYGGNINDPLANIKDLKADIIFGDINDYDLISKLTAKNYNHILVLAYSNKEIEEADSITLMTLIHLRDIAKKNGLNYSITSEMLDVNNRELAKVAKVNDFIVSEKLTSLLLAQISENKFLSPVFEDLLSHYGSEIYLKKAKYYIKTGEIIDFYSVLEAAFQKDDLAIGYKIASEENMEDKNFGIYLNPCKSKTIKFSENDCLIVLSEKL